MQSEQHVIYRLMAGHRYRLSGGRDWLKLTWKKLTEKDCLALTTVDPQERSTWRSVVRSAMRTAEPVTWNGGPTDVNDARCTCA